MKRVGKGAGLVVALATAGLALAACGGGTVNEAASSSAAPAESSAAPEASSTSVAPANTDCGSWGVAMHAWVGYTASAQVLSDVAREKLGSTGFGKAFLNAANKQWGLTMHDDLIDAVDWAIAEGITEAGKVAIMGGSYGGYATLAGLTFTPEVFACGVDIVGPSNLETLLETIPPYWAPLVKTFHERMGNPGTEEGKALLRAASPLYKADRITKPLLIAQGANDPRVKQSESDQIVGAMKAAGIPVTYVLYPDEGHGFARPENNIAFYAIAENFLAECLGGRAEPLGDALRPASAQIIEGAEHVKGLEAALAA